MLTDEQRLDSHAEGGNEREIEGAGRYQPVFYVILAWVVQGLIRPQNGRLNLVRAGPFLRRWGMMALRYRLGQRDGQNINGIHIY